MDIVIKERSVNMSYMKVPIDGVWAELRLIARKNWKKRLDYDKFKY